ncbi:hypothetical protein WDW86_15315 [Bdellovibrionota bacterium FG-2]
MSKTKNDDGLEGVAILAAVVAMVIAIVFAFFWILQKLPVILIGVLIGTLAHASLFRWKRGIDQARAFVFTFVFTFAFNSKRAHRRPFSPSAK